MRFPGLPGSAAPVPIASRRPMRLACGLHEQLARRGVDLSRGRSGIELQAKSIVQVINEDFVAIDPKTSVEDAIKASILAQSSEGYCVSEDKTFTGKFAITMLLNAPPKASVKKYLMQDPVYLNHDASLLQAMEVASNFVGETIPVINNENGQLIGVVSEGDIFDAYLVTQSRVHDLEHD